MSRSTVSRRVSEFVGVALFAAALIWIDRARQLRAGRPGLVLQRRLARRAGQLRRPRRRVPRRAVVPAVRLRRRTSSRRVSSSSAGISSGAEGSTRAGTKATGAGAAVRLHQRLPEPRVRQRSRSPASRSAPAAMPASGWPRELSEYLNRTGSVIVILTLIFLAIIMSTQFSFGRLLRRDPRGGGDRRRRARGARFREWREERRREQQRREVIAKHTKKARAPPRRKAAAPASAGAVAATPPRSRGRKREEAPARAGRRASGGPKSVAPPKPPKVTMPAPPLPLPIRSRGEGAGRTPQGRVHPAAARAARRAEDRAQDRRARADGRRAAARGEMPRVLGRRRVVQIHPGPVVTTFEFKPDAGVKYSKITGLADDLCLAMQAESVLIDRIPGKSTVGIQIPEPRRASRFRCASCSNRRSTAGRPRS